MLAAAGHRHTSQHSWQHCAQRPTLQLQTSPSPAAKQQQQQAVGVVLASTGWDSAGARRKERCTVRHAAAAPSGQVLPVAAARSKHP